MEILSFLLGLLILALAQARKPDNAVLLSNVKSLTFRDGKLTTARRVDPIPQVSVRTTTNANQANVCRSHASVEPPKASINPTSYAARMPALRTIPTTSNGHALPLFLQSSSLARRTLSAKGTTPQTMTTY